MVLTDDEVAAGLADGSLVEDTRLQRPARAERGRSQERLTRPLALAIRRIGSLPRSSVSWRR